MCSQLSDQDDELHQCRLSTVDNSCASSSSLSDWHQSDEDLHVHPDDLQEESSSRGGWLQNFRRAASPVAEPSAQGGLRRCYEADDWSEASSSRVIGSGAGLSGSNPSTGRGSPSLSPLKEETSRDGLASSPSSGASPGARPEGRPGERWLRQAIDNTQPVQASGGVREAPADADVRLADPLAPKPSPADSFLRPQATPPPPAAAQANEAGPSSCCEERPAAADSARRRTQSRRRHVDEAISPPAASVEFSPPPHQSATRQMNARSAPSPLQVSPLADAGRSYPVLSVTNR